MFSSHFSLKTQHALPTVTSKTQDMHMPDSRINTVNRACPTIVRSTSAYVKNFKLVSQQCNKNINKIKIFFWEVMAQQLRFLAKSQKFAGSSPATTELPLLISSSPHCRLCHLRQCSVLSARAHGHKRVSAKTPARFAHGAPKYLGRSLLGNNRNIPIATASTAIACYANKYQRASVRECSEHA